MEFTEIAIWHQSTSATTVQSFLIIFSDLAEYSRATNLSKITIYF